VLAERPGLQDEAAFAERIGVRQRDGDAIGVEGADERGDVRRQAGAWDPVLAWARRRFDVDFEVTTGVMHRAQPARTTEQLGRALAARDPFRLAALAPLVTISGSLLIALALDEGEIDLETAWAAATVDEAWQTEQWGEDAEAAARLEARRAEFEAAYRLLGLL